MNDTDIYDLSALTHAQGSVLTGGRTFPGYTCGSSSSNLTYGVIMGGINQPNTITATLSRFNNSGTPLYTGSLPFPRATGVCATFFSSANQAWFSAYFGGDDGNGTHYNDVVIYYPANGSVLIATTPLSVPRSYSSATVTEDGRYVLVIGGNNQAGASPAVDVLNTDTLLIERSFNLSSAKNFHSSAALGPYVYVAGGSNVTVYVIDTRDWTVFPSDPLPGSSSYNTGVSVPEIGVWFAGGSIPNISFYSCGNSVLPLSFCPFSFQF